MNAHLETAKAAFFDAYFATKAKLAKLPRQTLIDLQHEATEIKGNLTLPFSERAAAEIVHAATDQLLEGK